MGHGYVNNVHGTQLTFIYVPYSLCLISMHSSLEEKLSVILTDDDKCNKIAIK